eukprot:788757-Pyramimonas_sp.AAC.1
MSRGGRMGGFGRWHEGPGPAALGAVASRATRSSAGVYSAMARRLPPSLSPLLRPSARASPLCGAGVYSAVVRTVMKKYSLGLCLGR